MQGLWIYRYCINQVAGRKLVEIVVVYMKGSEYRGSCDSCSQDSRRVIFGSQQIFLILFIGLRLHLSLVAKS